MGGKQAPEVVEYRARLAEVQRLGRELAQGDGGPDDDEDTLPGPEGPDGESEEEIEQ